MRRRGGFGWWSVRRRTSRSCSHVAGSRTPPQDPGVATVSAVCRSCQAVASAGSRRSFRWSGGAARIGARALVERAEHESRVGVIAPRGLSHRRAHDAGHVVRRRSLRRQLEVDVRDRPPAVLVLRANSRCVGGPSVGVRGRACERTRVRPRAALMSEGDRGVAFSGATTPTTTRLAFAARGFFVRRGQCAHTSPIQPKSPCYLRPR